VCVCDCGADRGRWSSSGCGLVAGWCVCVVLGWWVRSPSRLRLPYYCCHTKQCAPDRPQPQAEKNLFFYFAVKHNDNEKAIDNRLYISAVPNYIRLYPTISRHIHIPSYPTHIPPYQTRDIPKIYTRRGLARSRSSCVYK